MSKGDKCDKHKRNAEARGRRAISAKKDQALNSAQHIAMNCIDRIRQEKFYTSHLGFSRARVFNAGTPNEFVMIRLGSLCLELFGTPVERHSQRGGEQAIGFKHLAFEVPSLEQARGSLAAAGVKVGDVIDCSDIQPGMRVCFFQDPEGNILEIMEGYKDQANPPALS